MRARYGLGDVPLLLSVGRLVARKGQDNLIRALPAILRRVPEAVVLIVGDGPDGPRLRGLVSALGVDRQVHFAGSVPWVDLPAHYAAADVFAMPCRTRGSGLDVEGLGIVFLEASASGLPVIAGRSGGAPETVQPGRTGVVVDGRDVAQVARATTDLLTDRDRASDLGGEWPGVGEPNVELGQFGAATCRVALRIAFRWVILRAPRRVTSLTRGSGFVRRQRCPARFERCVMATRIATVCVVLVI